MQGVIYLRWILMIILVPIHWQVIVQAAHLSVIQEIQNSPKTNQNIQIGLGVRVVDKMQQRFTDVRTGILLILIQPQNQSVILNQVLVTLCIIQPEIAVQVRICLQNLVRVNSAQKVKKIIVLG